MPLHTAPTTSEQEIWHRIMALTEGMLRAAQAGNWNEVEEKDRERQPLLFSFFEREENPGAVKTIMDDIHTILARDKLVAEIGERRRKKLEGALAGMRHHLHGPAEA